MSNKYACIQLLFELVLACYYCQREDKYKTTGNKSGIFWSYPPIPDLNARYKCTCISFDG